MSRFAWWRRRQHVGSRATEPAGRSRRGSRRPTAAVLPDSNGQLSDGIVIETRLKARLLGAPLLRVDGTVVVTPGKLVELTQARAVDEVARLDTAPSRAVSGRATPHRGPGEDLSRAARLIADTQGSISAWHHS